MIAAIFAMTLIGVGPTPATILESVQGSYQELGELSADFSQTYVDKLRGRRPVETGKLWVKKDGRVRWSYQKPTLKDFVYDGERAYFYEPSNAQVTVFEQFEDSQLSMAMRFLWGQGDVGKLFDVLPCDENCGVGEASDWKVKLNPKSALPTLKFVILVVDPKTKRPKISVVYDNLGNTTEYAFTNFKKEKEIPPKKFEFKIPKGVSVLRSRLSSTSTKPKAQPELDLRQ